MADHYVVDRRLNPKGKSLGNRQKFIQKAKKELSEKLIGNTRERNIKDVNGKNVSISSDGINEPEFSYDYETGKRDMVLPGNKKHVVGDYLRKPPPSSGGSDASDSGEGLDEFEFTLSREEYLQIIFDGLELPNMEKRGSTIKSSKIKRAGFSNSGNPTNLNIERSLTRSLGRRIALKFPKKRKIEELEKMLLVEKDAVMRKEIEEKISFLKKQHNSIPFIDPVDLKYNSYIKEETPVTSATMICMMDVSGSMDSFHKELAKRFYLLLYLFLEKKYTSVDIVFIRHHTEAKECDENDFFYSKETGGTLVSSGLMLVEKIIRERYPKDTTNLYVCQITDGDNYTSDNSLCNEIITRLLKEIRGYFYIEAHPHGRNVNISDLWDLMYNFELNSDNMYCGEMFREEDVISVFRDIFKKDL